MRWCHHQIKGTDGAEVQVFEEVKKIEVFIELFVDSFTTLKSESFTCISFGNFRILCPVSRYSIAYSGQIWKSVCLDEHLNSIHLVLFSTFGKYTFGKYTFKVP